jgi:hypothetical protein
LQKASPLIFEVIREFQTAQENEFVLARARLHPKMADQILQRYENRTGRLLPKPIPFAAKDRAKKTKEMVGALSDRQLMIEAARHWEEVIADRLNSQEIREEVASYQDRLAQLKVSLAQIQRRQDELTGERHAGMTRADDGDDSEKATTPVEPGGLIGKQRRALDHVARQGILHMGIKVLLLALAACFLPLVVTALVRVALRRNIKATGSTLLLTSLPGFARVLIWIVCGSMILSTLGMDVMAILTGLGIVGFAICIAATPMIADAIAAFVIFVEERFTIDDVVKIGIDEPAVIVGLTWRSTQLKNAEGMMFSLPNRKLTEQSVQNLTIDGRTIDFISATVTTKHDPEKIMQVLRQAMDGVANLLQDAERGTSVQEIEVNGDKKTI